MKTEKEKLINGKKSVEIINKYQEKRGKKCEVDKNTKTLSSTVDIEIQNKKKKKDKRIKRVQVIRMHEAKNGKKYEERQKYLCSKVEIKKKDNKKNLISCKKTYK